MSVHWLGEFLIRWYDPDTEEETGLCLDGPFGQQVAEISVFFFKYNPLSIFLLFQLFYKQKFICGIGEYHLISTYEAVRLESQLQETRQDFGGTENKLPSIRTFIRLSINQGRI